MAIAQTDAPAGLGREAFIRRAGAADRPEPFPVGDQGPDAVFAHRVFIQRCAHFDAVAQAYFRRCITFRVVPQLAWLHAGKVGESEPAWWHTLPVEAIDQGAEHVHAEAETCSQFDRILAAALFGISTQQFCGQIDIVGDVELEQASGVEVLLGFSA